MKNHVHKWEYVGNRPDYLVNRRPGYQGEFEFVCSCGAVKLTLPKELQP